MMVHLKIKLTSLQFCIAMTALNLSICHPTGIQRQYMPSATMYYHRHEQNGSICPHDRQLPSNQEGVQTVDSRRRISSPIYAAARHYHHQLTAKGVRYRCLVGYYATRRQIGAYGGRRWPLFIAEVEAAARLCLLFFVERARGFYLAFLASYRW